MNSEQKERRKHRRIYFSKNDAVYAHLRNLNEEETIVEARMKDLSEGGIGFMLQRNDSMRVRPEDRLAITAIEGSAYMDFLIQVELVVKWIVDTDILDHIGFGCIFETVDASVQEKVKRYISVWS